MKRFLFALSLCSLSLSGFTAIGFKCDSVGGSVKLPNWTVHMELYVNDVQGMAFVSTYSPISRMPSQDIGRFLVTKLQKEPSLIYSNSQENFKLEITGCDEEFSGYFSAEADFEFFRGKDKARMICKKIYTDPQGMDVRFWDNEFPLECNL